MERLMVTLYDVAILGDFVQLLRQQETSTLEVNMELSILLTLISEDLAYLLEQL